ncbi:hypothetical protein N7532_006006 [Penicillium argentinense]|uniref:Uncharacterized protein n=1 Tax=Penicillium argentinense TaxID=1131581 RepID=A0A9W9FEZ7_9EURO|nr:uncharacterized protein N7532_006006 [Penicillium argentinense]KAJ5099005.1 hypothetical protein N7532_006006 [Penicillium argentinense]
MGAIVTRNLFIGSSILTSHLPRYPKDLSAGWLQHAAVASDDRQINKEKDIQTAPPEIEIQELAELLAYHDPVTPIPRLVLETAA